MTATERFFLDTLGDHLRGEKTAPADGIDHGELAALCDIHSCGGIVWAECRELLKGRAEAEKIHPAFMSDVYIFECRKRAVSEIESCLNAEGIRYMPLKGAVIASLYPVPELRTMGDIDILVDVENMDRVAEFMKRLGYSLHIETPCVYEFSRGLLVFEFHSRAIYEDIGNGTDAAAFFDSFFEHATCDGLKYTPDAAFHYAYLAAHTAKHIVNRGCGFRAFADMALAARELKNSPEAAERALGYLSSLKLSDFESICSALCVRWFGLELLSAPAELTDEFYDETTVKVLKDGVFGKSNPDSINEHGEVAKSMRSEGAEYRRAASSYFWGRLFPSYEEMRYVDSYKFIDGRKWLTPLAWFKRFFVSLFTKPAASARLALHPFIRKKDIEKRNEFLSSFGIGNK